MMNNYLFLEEENHAFYTSLLLRIKSLGIYELTKCKIDTGCSLTNIPIRRLNISDEQAYKLKADAINNSIPYFMTYGVSDTKETREIDQHLLSQNRLLDIKSLRFSFDADTLVIGNQELGVQPIGINFDRTGNILIGMDTLKNFQIVIDTSVITRKYTLIGCLKSQIDKTAYIAALRRHFNF